MKFHHSLLLFITAVLLNGCAELTALIEAFPSDNALSETEVVEGLKEALIVGSRNSSSVLSVTDGYYRDELVKILLPDEAAVIIDNLGKIPGGAQLVEDVILRINRSAEDAAKQVAPIFVNSIRQMSVSDAFGILNGEENAATQYLITTTRKDLYQLYQPKIRQSTQKEIIGGISTKESWDALTGKWNQFARSIPGQAAGFKAVETDLDDYLTKRALDGMFLKVEEEEKKIRTEVSARISPILEKVFGSLDR